MAVVVGLWCVAALFAVAVFAVALGRHAFATPLIYASCLAISLVALTQALLQLDGGGSVDLTLPLGLPWLGANFRVDALSAFFLVVVNLGGSDD